MLSIADKNFAIIHCNVPQQTRFQSDIRPAGAGLVRVIGLLSGEEEQALLVVGSAQQGGLPGHGSSALCGGQRALGLDALLGDALVQGHSQETLCVLDFAKDARHSVCDQVHHLWHAQ